MPLMRRSLLSALALISVLVLTVLAFGCVAEFGPAYYHNVGGQNPHALDIEIKFKCGRVAIYWEVWNNQPAVVAKIPPGTHLYWRGVRFGAPDLRRMGWEFDAHPLPPVLPGSIGPWVFLFAFPIWCIAIPFLIAPVMWLRGRKAPELAGFSVIQSSDAKPD